jgi:hypothetical protein
MGTLSKHPNIRAVLLSGPSKNIGTASQRKRIGERRFRPIAIEIGWLAYEWNRLHAELAELFAAIVSGPQIEIPLSIWHSVHSDRTQRDMLRAALDTAYKTTALTKAIYDGAKGVLDDLNSLAGKRNTALHAPLAFVINTNTSDVEIWPHGSYGNPHAWDLTKKQLTGDKIVLEFKWHRSNLARLADYVWDVRLALKNRNYALPKKPPLLPREHVTIRARRRRKRSRK